MKALMGLILSVIAHGAVAQAVELHVMVNGAQQAVKNDEVVAALTAIVESSTVDTTEYVRPAEHWDEALSTPVFVHALFSQPRAMKVWKASDTTERTLSDVHEIVIVFPGAQQIFVKTRDGVRSIAKYSPCALQKVVTTAGLEAIARADYLRQYCKQL